MKISVPSSCTLSLATEHETAVTLKSDGGFVSAGDRRREKCFCPVRFRGSLVTSPGKNISPGGCLVGFSPAWKVCIAEVGAGSFVLAP
ncbi:hypothetical protein C4J81_09005 [Deltaproteobacteria bacterium Smac51]|nr:hypothetical protein C4J81_09005 [Deltaproteobacteria bacterium Smac51]